MPQRETRPEERHAQFLAGRLEQFGIQVELEPGGVSATGRLSLSSRPFPSLLAPFTAEQARFYTLGHNRIKVFNPALFFPLPALNVSSCTSARAIESALRSAWSTHVGKLREAQRWLERINANARTDPRGLLLVLDLPQLEGPATLVRSRTELLIPSSGLLREVSLEGPSARTYRPLPGLECASDLEIGLSHEIDHRAAAASRARAPAPARAKQGDSAPPETELRRVLVVDSDRAVLAAAEQALVLRGLHVETSPDSMRSLQAFQKGSFDIVVANTRIPRMDGLELTASIRDLPGIAELPILLLDDRPNSASRRAAESVGAAGYIAKPPHWDDVAETLLDLLAGWDKRRFDRFPIRLRVELEDSSQAAPTLTDSVGRGGIYILSAWDTNPGSIDRYRITLPGRIGSIRVEGIIAYRLDTVGRTRIGLGIRFLRFPDKDELRWISMIETLARGAQSR
ncbi:MAG: response regulator [Myxococcota bacterium]